MRSLEVFEYSLRISNSNRKDRCEEKFEDQQKLVIFLNIIVAVTFALIALNGLDGSAATVNVCSGVKDMIFLPYLNNCSRYYVCLNNTPIARECETGFLFDAKNQSCTYPDQAQCIPTCSSALSSFCYDRTCTKYVLCYAGQAVVRECCDGLQYNAETDRCDFPQYVDCVDNMCTIFNDPDNITFLASKAACEKYYICMDGNAHGQSCSNGLQFNPSCNCCDFPDNVNCTITASKRNIASLSKAPPKRADIDCPEDGVHFFPHKINEKYYFCLNGRGVILECTPGLVYDAKAETCREPSLVGSAF